MSEADYLAARRAAAESVNQEWGLALLFSVNPSDRALTGWGAARCGDSLLTLLAAREHDRRPWERRRLVP